MSSRWIVDGGLRAEALTGRDWAALSPRVTVKFLATPELAFTVGAGRATQWMQSLAGDGPLRYFDVWVASDSFTPVSTAWHWVAGVERRIPSGSVRVEGYLKQYDRVMEANWSEDPSDARRRVLHGPRAVVRADMIARHQPRTGWAGGSRTRMA